MTSAAGRARVSMWRRLAPLVSVLLVALLGGCRRATADWIADLGSEDPWRRRMAVLALSSVGEEECELAFRALVIRLKDRDPDVAVAIEQSVRALGRRRPDLPARALRIMAAERVGQRAFLARVLLELEAAGVTVDRAPLAQYFAGEAASGVSDRAAAARALQAEFGAAPDEARTE